MHMAANNQRKKSVSQLVNTPPAPASRGRNIHGPKVFSFGQIMANAGGEEVTAWC